MNNFSFKKISAVNENLSPIRTKSEFATSKTLKKTKGKNTECIVLNILLQPFKRKSHFLFE